MSVLLSYLKDCSLGVDNMGNTILNWMSDLFNHFAESVVSVLPLSPFRSVINSWGAGVPQGIAWLNWLVPVSQILGVFAAWLSAYALYLLASIVLRWIKAIE